MRRGKVLLLQEDLGSRAPLFGKAHVHYIEVFLEDEPDDSDLELGADTMELGSPRVEGTIESMITSLHGVKKYLTLNIMG